MEAKDLINEQMVSLAEKLKTATEQERSTCIAELQQLVKVYEVLENLDLERTEKDRRFKEDIRQKDLDRHYKDMLERDRMFYEKEKDESERKFREHLEEIRLTSEKKNSWRDFAARAVGVVLPTTISALFLGLGMKLEFLDNGSVCSFTVKELMRKAMAPKLQV